MSDISPNRNHAARGGRSVGLMEVAFRDAVAFTAGLLLVMDWLMLLTIVFFIAQGGRKPKESPLEIVLGMALITAVLLMVIALRGRIIGGRLDAWTPVRAEVYHAAQVQFFITVGLRYRWRGAQIRRTVRVPSLKATGFLVDRKAVTVAVDPENPRKLVIAELYGQGR